MVHWCRGAAPVTVVLENPIIKPRSPMLTTLDIDRDRCLRRSAQLLAGRTALPVWLTTIATSRAATIGHLLWIPLDRRTPAVAGPAPSVQTRTRVRVSAACPADRHDGRRHAASGGVGRPGRCVSADRGGLRGTFPQGWTCKLKCPVSFACERLAPLDTGLRSSPSRFEAMAVQARREHRNGSWRRLYALGVTLRRVGPRRTGSQQSAAQAPQGEPQLGGMPGCLR
jgi:hypothetical protein